MHVHRQNSLDGESLAGNPQPDAYLCAESSVMTS